MTSLSPIRVSLYDFLYQDTLPIDAVVADYGQCSLLQARVLIESSIQAIISGLLAYNQTEGSDAVLKKLLTKNQVKELRKCNAFNFQTMHTATHHGQTMCDALFENTDIQKAVTQHVANTSHLSTKIVRPLLSGLTLLCLREVAILADYSHLDSSEMDAWLCLQPQFLVLSRPDRNPELSYHTSASLSEYAAVNDILAPQYDTSWHEITRFNPPSQSTIQACGEVPQYAKVIGRTASTRAPNISNSDKIINNTGNQWVVDESNNSDVLSFSQIQDIALPYQRWLLQLAKIADIYLNRNRLKIAPNPKQPPARPLVKFGLTEKITTPDNTTSASTRLASKKPRKPSMFNNPVLIMLVVVIGGLSLLAVGKYHLSKSTQLSSSVQPIATDTASTTDSNVSQSENNSSH